MWFHSSFFIATEYLEQSDSERWMLIVLSTLICTLLVICTIAMLIYRTYRNNILARLGKPMSYNDQFMDSTALRTGTYTVDHLKLTTIVGTLFSYYISDCKVMLAVRCIYNFFFFRTGTIWFCLAR